MRSIVPWLRTLERLSGACQFVGGFVIAEREECGLHDVFGVEFRLVVHVEGAGLVLEAVGQMHRPDLKTVLDQVILRKMLQHLRSRSRRSTLPRW